MKIVTMRAVHVTFCTIFLTAVFTTVSSDYPLTQESYLANACPNKNLSITFSENVINKLAKNFISNPFITCLDLEGNKIQTIEKDAFSGVPALRYLNMAKNKIDDPMAFGSHENLETLILANQINQDEQLYGHNRFVYYSPKLLKIYGRYPQLRYLDLSSNYIDSIEWAMKDNNAYKDLSQQIPKLKYLDLSNNVINRFFFNEFSSSSLSLTHIYLRDNEMVSANLKYLKEVVVLIADNNNIQYLQKNNCYDYSLCVSVMPQLKNLSISNNKVDRIDSDFFEEMHELTTLNLSSNRLENIFDGLFDDLISLENLDLSNNLLTTISIFKKPSQLSSLSLNLNKIWSINAEDFTNVRNLRKLYLNNNDFTSIHKNAFRLLNLLEELHLANNNLISLPAEWSNDLENLRNLNLTNNNFKYLEFLSLSNKLPLTELYLMGNEIINITSKALQDIPENATIYLAYDRKEIEFEPNE